MSRPAGHGRLGRAAIVAAAAAALGGGGCGQGPAREALSETAESLGDLRGGDLDLRVLASPRGEPLDRGAGFTVRGPFSLGPGGGLPVADVTYTRIAGTNRGTAGLISTGREAFVRLPGGTYALGPERESALARVAGRPGGETGLERLDVARWVRDPRLTDGGSSGGIATERVTGALDVVRAANALLGATGRPGPIEGREARRLERAVRSSRVVLETGADDRLLRRLAVEVDLEADVPAEIRSGLGPLGGARFRLDLEIRDPNRPVRVAAPPDVRPASALAR